MYRIGAFAQLCGLSIETLRHYDRMGVLTPAHVDSQSGYRLYDASQLSQVNRILALKDAGFSLREIGAMQSELHDAPALIGLLEEKAAEMQSALDAERERLSRLHSSIFLIKNGGIPLAGEITVKATETILVCGLRRTIEKQNFDAALEQMWPAVNAEIDRAGIQRIIPCMMRYHEGTWDHAGDKLDIEVIEPIAAAFDAQDAVKVYTLPAVQRMACIVHNGPFETIGSAFRALIEWMEQNCFSAAGPLREIYHRGDWMTDNPAEYVTEIQIPIE